MGAFRNEEVSTLLGDFYEYNTAKNRSGMDATLKRIENMLFSGEVDSDAFRDYFNDIFCGRSSFNVNLTITDYPKQSVLRELMQNTFGCDYDDKDIKVIIEFLDEGRVRINYNEVGFNLEQVFYYLSVGRNDGDRRREGRFGLGSKSVFLNVEWFTLRSNNFRFRVVNDGGIIRIRELDLTAVKYKGTEIVFKVPEEDYQQMREDLLTLTSRKGVYISMAEFAFAFIKKKYLKSNDEDECHERTFNIAIIDKSKPKVLYKVAMHQADENSVPKVRFYENGKSVIEFIWYENNDYVYLTPFAIASSRRADVVKVLLAEYNYFSTFELTGLIKATGEEFIREKLMAFFISVPNRHITSNRSGIKTIAEREVATSIGFDLLTMIERYRDYFMLEVAKRNNSEQYYLRPKHYVFEFFSNYIEKSVLTQEVKNKFNDNISLILPEHKDSIPYNDIKENGYASVVANVTRQEHENGSARQKYIIEPIDKAHRSAEGMDNLTVAAVYQWEDRDAEDENLVIDRGTEFIYEFRYDGKVYVVDSDGNSNIQGFNLWVDFKDILNLRIAKFTVDNSVPNEDALENILQVFDETFGDDYKIDMRYFQLFFNAGNEEVRVEISKIDITNLYNAFETVSRRERRFATHQIYNEVVSILVNSFTNGKDALTFLREIKQQGGSVSLVLDINNRYRFSAYGKQFMIPPNITNNDLVEIVGDVYSLINCGMFNNRIFDFEHRHLPYNYDASNIAGLLDSEHNNREYIQQVISKLFVCDLSIDKIAVIDGDNKIKRIIGLDEELSAEEIESSSKIVILKDNISKSELANFIEFALTGINKRILHRYYSSTEEPNQLLIDQIPYYLKPIMDINEEEFEYLRTVVDRVSRIEDKRIRKNYFTKDINGKLFGYGGNCTCCNYQSEIVNSFVVKDFEVGLFKGERETKFKFSLYLCANDALAASGWIIEDIQIGGMTPFEWIDTIKQSGCISRKLLSCKVYYRRQLTYQMMDESKSYNTLTEDNVHEGARQVMEVVLSPLMAAKWYEDNKFI